MGRTRAAWTLLALVGCSFEPDYRGTDYRCEENLPCPTGYTCEASVCRLDGDGGGSDAGGQISCEAGENVRLTDTPGSSARGALTWAGDGGALVWEQDTTDPGIYLVRVGADLTPQAPTVISNYGNRPSIAASSDGDLGVAWAQNISMVQTMRFRPVIDGVAGTTQSLTTQEATVVPSRSHLFVEGYHAVIWQDGVDGQDEIFYRRIAPDGTAMPLVRVTENVGASVFPSMAWNGSEWGVVWNDDRDGNFEIYFTRMDLDGERLDGDVRLTNGPGASFAPTIAVIEGGYLVSWWDGRTDPPEIYTAVVTIDAGAAIVGDDVPLLPGEYGQVGTLAVAGEQLGIAWHATLHDTFEPYFAPLTPDGRLAGDPVRVSTGGVDIDVESLTIIPAGDAFAVAWSDSRDGDVDVYATLVTCE